MHPDGYLFSSDPALVDADLVYTWLSTDAYWALGRPREMVDRSFAGSRLFGVYRPDTEGHPNAPSHPNAEGHPNAPSRPDAPSHLAGPSRPEADGRPGAQVAFARAVTDGATFVWLCDVYVDRAVRGRGLGTWMVTQIRDELEREGLRRILLATADAHAVYAKLGFTPLAEPDRWMEYRRPQADQ
ncbi:GNAT family N-acetyltransferase [Phytohabitans kaempferiae]|uniref:GNAT family N-acetyltransferase n=1 Tax=Phytohabitans kaempferiae TaxID=1620943 RepID=A0ABV6LWK0_9ACTN